jgi:hypothetical protein
MLAARTGPAAHVRSLLTAALLLGLLTGCNRQQATLPAQTATPAAAATPTSSPTPAVSRMVLIAPATGGDPSSTELAKQTQAALRELAASAEMESAALEGLPGDEAAGVVLLVVLPPDPGVRAWAESHPATQVVSLGIAGVRPASNLSVIASDGIRHDQLGFALGYLAAMVTPEYRVGALVLDSSAAHLALARGFVAGGTYYCGLCNPIHPPYVEYPALLMGVPDDWTADGISTLLVAPQPQSFSDLGLPSNSGIAFVGTGEPTGELASAWIASVDFDIPSALNAAWAQAQSGEGGTILPLGIQYRLVDGSVVSEGRLALAEALLADLSAGVIDTGVDPLTGELR